MSQAYALMRSYIAKVQSTAILEVFLKNGKKLQGEISSLEEKSFIIKSATKGSSMVYLSKVSTIAKAAPINKYGSKLKTSFDSEKEPNGNVEVLQDRTTNKSSPVIINKRSRSKMIVKPTPSDIESDRYQQIRINEL